MDHSSKKDRIPSHEGNDINYGFDRIEQIPSALKDKAVCVLGSSVVYGQCSRGQAIAEYLARRFGCICTKEAVSGTTLVDEGSQSYIRRLKRLDTSRRFDLFICQLSTNDATRKKPLGEISSDENSDTGTVTGATEYIINYARDTWGCPVIFFTGSHYESRDYDAMVGRLYELKEKYGIGVIDLWNDEAFNRISDEERALYMRDPIHPPKPAIATGGDRRSKSSCSLTFRKSLRKGLDFLFRQKDLHRKTYSAKKSKPRPKRT